MPFAWAIDAIVRCTNYTRLSAALDVIAGVPTALSCNLNGASRKTQVQIVLTMRIYESLLADCKSTRGEAKANNISYAKCFKKLWKA